MKHLTKTIWLSFLLAVMLGSMVLGMQMVTSTSSKAYAATDNAVRVGTRLDSETPKTLNKVLGHEYVDNQPSRKLSDDIKVVSDSTAIDSNAYSMNLNWYGTVTSNNSIVMDTPIKHAEISELIIRLKIDGHVQDPFYTDGVDNGIVLYPMGAVGEANEGVLIQPGKIKQREWVDYVIGSEEAKKLADSDGMIKALCIGGTYDWVITSNNNNAGNFDYGYGLPPAGGADWNFNIQIDTVSYTPYSETTAVEYLTQCDGGLTERGTTTIVEVNGRSGAMFDNVEDALNERDLQIVYDSSAIDGKAAKVNLFAWSAARSTNALKFNKPIVAAETDGIVVRLKLHIRDRLPYASSELGFGVYLFDIGATGKAAEQFTIPTDTIQNEYVKIYINKENLIRMAGKDGKLEGFQIASYLHIGIDKGTYDNAEPYIAIDYVVAAPNAKITYQDGSSVIKTAMSPINYKSTSAFYVPTKEGKFFLNWQEGGEIFDFNADLKGDVNLTANWVDLASDLNTYYGLYKSQDGKYISIMKDWLDISAVAEAYDSYGVGSDGKLYIRQGMNCISVDLDSEYKKVDSVMVTYNTLLKNNPVVYQLVEKNLSAIAPELVRNGYEISAWIDAQGKKFDFNTKLSADITLTAVYSPVEINDVNKYFGQYYDVTSKTIVILKDNHIAEFMVNGQKTTREYYILKDNVIAFAAEKDFDEGTMLAARMMFEGKEFVKLTQYSVIFNSDGGTEIDRQIVNADSGYRVTKPADPVKDGYVFKGWYLADNSQFDFDSIVTESISLYAHWDFAAVQDEQSDKSTGCGSSAVGFALPVAISFISLSAVLFKKKRV